MVLYFWFEIQTNTVKLERKYILSQHVYESLSPVYQYLKKSIP